jgi:hypothetical protein
MAPLKPNDERALDAVVSRAATDPKFRAALLTEPRQAIQQAFGVRVPDDVRVKFIERPPDVDALIVLPDVRRADGELADADLESVSGGALNNWADPFPIA